ncbi:DUF5696 domain-containing protein [Aquibacillus salsiterrae]|uniref:DUF5696 domain-containing protein n=1 Tax=Aquibacillus salsiterrae TaxID=2950439 RepID=A0A9X3WH07_9BACI|nr:DUF5696 domain-containing protein [Aquibacillus salsiterrae]MDC3416866.1 DUF5696 domain-containing protein [Aquibacillus salsiterrae]
MVNKKTLTKSIMFIIIASLVFFIFTKDDDSENDESQYGNGSATTQQKSNTSKEELTPQSMSNETEEMDNIPEVRAKQVDTTQEEIDGHKYLLENDKYEMYFKEENLSIIMRDKTTGAVMYSTVENPVESNQEWKNFMKSAVVMEYLVGTNIVTYRADMYSENPTKEVVYKNDGFVAKVTYPGLEISYQLEVTLTDSGIVVEIPQDKIVENSDKFKVSGFYVYPFLGYSKLDNRDGYMFIPDGSGALIYLEDNDGKYKQPYSEMVYGNNPGVDESYVLSLFHRMNPFNETEKILAPVFGMVQTDTQMGYLGIIEEGQYSAKIEAYPNGAILPYNWITSKFIYRQVYNQPTSKDSGTMVVRQKSKNDFNIKVRYQFVSKDEADYVGLAQVYRDYLLETDQIVEQEDQFKARVDLFGADVENGLIFKKDVPMTTFAQASSIYGDLQENGVDQILSIYKGWQNGGYYAGLPIQSFDPESSLDDEMELKELLNESKERNIDLFLYHDALRINMEELGNTRYKVMKKFNKRTYEEGVYGKAYQYLNYLNPESTVEILKEVEDTYKNNGTENVMISGISNKLFSYSERSKEFDRIATKERYESIISEYDQNFNLMLEQPFSYLWKYSNAIIDLPTQSSDYIFTDEDIPFIALTLKGIVPMYAEYINFQANQVEFFLKMVEQGLNPSFYITNEDPADLLNTNSSDIYSSKYERYKKMIQDYYGKLKQVNEVTEDSVIEDYVRTNGVTKVSYSNGATIYVNYQENDVIVDGQTIKALSYKVVQD